MKTPSSWSLIKPFWVSEEKWRAWGTLAIVLTTTFLTVYINVRVNIWSAGFYDTLQRKDWPGFISALELFCVLAFSYVIAYTAQTYFRQMLEIRWRRWITHRFIGEWLKRGAYYRIQRDRLADNPDQRIADDLREMVSSTLSLSLDLLSNLATLASFVPIIWSLSGPLAFSLFGHGLMIPGYMVWVGLAYAAFGSWATQLFARRLAVIEYDRQRFEADFRYLLVRVRENAEQIALYDGAAAEERHLKTSFSRIRENWRLVMTYTKRLNLVTAMYNQVGSIFPIIAAAPRFFSGALSFGVLIQLANGFGNMSTAMSWFLNNYGALATWRATMNRLREVARAIEAPEPEGGIVTTRAPGPALATHGLKLALPSGEPLNSIGDWRIEPGSRWLVRGPSGCGKSTLVRALAGLWPFGHGSVLKPDSMRSLFLPQRSYLPIGSLKTALCYPGAPTDFTDERCRDVLGACRIPMGDHLEQVADWSQRLSPGEQQRLAAARALLQEPDYLFLDEATSALDPETERLVYHALLERLPRTAFISVAHSQMLLAMHPSILDVKAIGAQQDVSPAGV